MSSPVKKPFRPSSAFPTQSTGNTSKPPSKPPSGTSTPTAGAGHVSNKSISQTSQSNQQPSAQPRDASAKLTKQNKRMSGDVAAARSYLSESSNATQSALLASQADRRNKLKKRVLILQTEKIKEMLWEKASLMQKRQMIDEEQREMNSLRQRIELDREERQKRWALEEAMRCEEEDEEVRFTAIRMRKFQQRYDFECAKREKMLKSRADKDGRRSSEITSQGNRDRLSSGARNEEKEFDNAYDNDELIDETDGYEFMSPGGTLDHSTLSRGPNDALYSHPSTTFNDIDEYTGNDQLRDLEDDVDFLSSDDEDADDDMQNNNTEASRSFHDDAHRPLSVSPLPMYSGNEADAQNLSQMSNEDPAERERREADETAEQEERSRREAEERATKEREWQALKSRLLAEARELQDKERQRLADEREAEQKRSADAMAAKDEQMNVLITRLKAAEHKLPALPDLPESANQSESPRQAESTVTVLHIAPTVDTNAPTSQLVQPSVAVTPNAASLPALSSITLRPAGGSVSQQSQSFVTNSVTVSLDEDLIDEPTQAPGSLNPLPSLSAVPQRKLNTNPISPSSAAPKKRETDSMAISSMLHELEELEEEEETILKMGVEVTKVPRTGKPKVVKLYIDQNDLGEWIVRWDTKKSNKSDACVVLNRSIRVIVGISGGLFTKPENEKRFSDKRNRCFSVVATDRTLDVCCLTFNDQELWTRTIQRLSKQKPRMRSPQPQPQPLVLTGLPAASSFDQIPPENYAPQPVATHSRVSSMLIGNTQAR